MRLTLCILCWNEVDGCRHDILRLPMDAFDEVFALDGGSDDGTVEYLREQGVDVRAQRRKGYNAAYFEAVEQCTGDAIVFFHPKGSIDPACVLRFREAFDAGAQLVVASRNAPGGRNEEDDTFFRPRKWFVQGLALAAALVWKREGARIGDVLHGVRGITTAAFWRMGLERSGVSIDLEMVVRAYRMRLPRAEFPVREGGRLAGTTHFKALPTGWRILCFFARELRRRGARRPWTAETVIPAQAHKEDAS
ncbi:glycosyltransferase family 2 protein [Desulfobaculum sp. SPO524]|uniref:glycosyltransferase family 2 protein n=1 Tax=Desulfobaculum sp. SPO524 TaxID=3378071 RepID=UPI003854FFA9